MVARLSVRLLLMIAVSVAGSGLAAAQTGWMQRGVRLWYLGGVEGGGPTSSNAEEAYLIDSVVGTTARVVHHSALTHWTAPRPVETSTASLVDQGPCWIHPQRLRTIAEGQSWREPAQIITLVERPTHTYSTFVSTVLPARAHLLPIKALFERQSTRSLVKISYVIDQFSVGNAWFDADTGILLYHHELWGVNKMFFVLAEINYDFARQAAFPEDGGPHTGFKAVTSERSMGSALGVGGGFVEVQSLVETRYGADVEMRVLSTITAPSFPAGTGELKMWDENYCFFGGVPLVRRMDATQAPNYLPEQWNAVGQHLWWWLPRTVLQAADAPTPRDAAAAAASINVLDVPMAKTADQPLTYTATQTPSRFHYTTLSFDANGYLTSFAARDPSTGLDVKPTDWVFVNGTATNGASYYQSAMAAAVNGPTLDPSVLRFGATKAGTAGSLVSVTPPQTVSVTFANSPSSWTATADQSWVQITNGAGAGVGRFTVSIVNPNNALGSSTSATATITVATGTGGQTTLPVMLAVQLGAAAGAPPFGVVDTPVNGTAGVTGSIGVTGWALDDVGVSGVKVYRDCLDIDNPASCQTVNGARVVFIGDAAFLAGARPDVEAAYSSHPLAYRAGWGYLMLTNMLPHIPNRNPAGGGQGTLTFSAFATDMEGHRVLLGRKTITLDNDHAIRPFGAIDTPWQGETRTGPFANFGWALTPGTALIPRDGSTMRVVLDGSSIGTVDYDQCRAGATNRPEAGACRDDVATLFPTLTNIRQGSGAIGSFVIDTSTLSNGLHTLAWGVVDNQNRNDGIGSRFFMVLNGSSADRPSASALADAPARILHDAAPIASRRMSASEVRGRSGFDFDAGLEALAPDGDGIRHVRLAEFGRLELSLGDRVTTGYLHANGTLRPLPPGSRLDPGTGIFTWSPGPGYFGSYDLVFLEGGEQIPIRVTIGPRPTAPAGRTRAYIDIPARASVVSGTFVVAGWALDLDAWQGSGIQAVHVWAVRRDVPAAAPVFLGAAELGGLRPDVARHFGVQFDRTGWGLTAPRLSPGVYDVTAYFQTRRTGQFDDGTTIRVTAR